MPIPFIDRLGGGRYHAALESIVSPVGLTKVPA
jgi:hypothetical protein